MEKNEPAMGTRYFLTESDCNFFAALCETVVPQGPDPNLDPGALTVGAIDYIDSVLHDSPKERQQYFRQAIEDLNLVCEKKFSSQFSALTPDQKDLSLKEFYLNPRTREKMFDLRSIVLEGFYSDYHSPEYNGVTGWEYVEFGGKRISDIKKNWDFLRVWRDFEEKK
jgi:hypothetical protein